MIVACFGFAATAGLAAAGAATLSVLPTRDAAVALVLALLVLAAGFLAAFGAP